MTAEEVCVLFVEDHESIGEPVMSVLEWNECFVVWVRTLAEARATYESVGYEFDVVLCDYELPDGKGIEFLREVQSEHGHPRTVLWSGLDRSRECAEAGFQPDLILTKSLSVKNVVDAVLGAS